MRPELFSLLPIAVCEFHLEQLSDPTMMGLCNLGDYSHAFVVFRLEGQVVGQGLFPVIKEQISVPQIRRHLLKCAWLVWQQQMAPAPTLIEPLPPASVVVCTRNRTDDLRRCLPGLLGLANQGYEVIIVDNCPSDARTAELVAAYPQIRYIQELRPGLNIARNCGLRAATGEIVAFTDDDAQIDAHWLEMLLRNFHHPMVAIVTGLTLPLELQTEAQYWFEYTNGFGRGFTKRSFDLNNIDPLATGQIGAGVNMAIRRNALQEIGWFDEALDGGTLTLSGGDQEFFYRTIMHGYRIVYEPAAVVWHKHRREWKALRRTIYGYGAGVFAWWTRALLVEKEFSLLFKAPLWFLHHHIYELIRSTLRRPGSAPLDLAWAEFAGAVTGPWRYLWARRQAQRQRQNVDKTHLQIPTSKQVQLS